MSSQFDDLLGDFGDSSTSTTVKTGGENTGAEDSGLLLDFSVDTEVTNGHQSNGFGMDNSSSANPLYDLSSNDNAQTADSSNPLYDFSITTDTNASSSTGNPLYDLTTDSAANQEESSSGANPMLFDLSADVDTTATTTSSGSANPLYDFDAAVTVDEIQKDAFQNEEDLLLGTNGAGSTATTTLTTGEADLLGDFGGSSNDQQQEEEQQQQEEEQKQQPQEPFMSMGEQEPVDFSSSTQDYSGLEVNSGSEALLDLGPTDSSTTAVSEQEDRVETTTYQEDAPIVEIEQTEVPQTLDDDETDQPAEVAETLPDLVVREEGDDDLHAQVGLEAESQPEPFGETQQEEEVEETETGATEGYGEEPEQEPPREEADHSVSMANEGEYHADRREEDLEQYCLHREEETSEVSDGIGESAAAAAVASEENGQPLETEPEAERQEDVDQTEGTQEHTEDQVVPDAQDAVSGPADVPEVEKEEAVVEAEAAEPQQEEEDHGPSDIPTSSYTSSSTIVLLASPTSPSPWEPIGGRITGTGIASIPSPAVVVSEEEVIEDGRTVTKTTRTENRYSSGSGFEDSQITKEVVHGNYTKNEPVKREQTPPKAAPRTQPDPVAMYDDDEEEEGVYENEPEQRDDVARETDAKLEENLPAAGTAQNLKARFMAVQQESLSQRPKREITPPNPTMGGGEYVSEPRMQWEQFEGKAESGVFESQPVYDEEVVRSGQLQEEVVPEHGTTKNVLAKFKQLESEKKAAKVSGKREITPDRSNRVEYVSEPRGYVETYEGKSESGVFESEPSLNPDVVRSGQDQTEELPERGTARNLADRFQQISAESSLPQTSRSRREITPDTSGRVEYVSEPRGTIEAYQPKAESGVFENKPQEEADVVKSQTAVEEFVPERGYTKNVAARFKELESNAKSPPLSPGRRKEFTPPREVFASQHSGVYESTPQSNPEVVSSFELPQEVLPEQGTTRNITQRFRQLEAESKSPPSAKPKKEFTPPPRDSGVYENQPERFTADYNRPAESGVIENTPQARDDVSREAEAPKYAEELPERGTARNLLSRWKQMETESKSPGSGRGQKEFTPPREEPRIAQQSSKSPRTPKSPPANASMDNGSVHPSELPGQYQPQNEPHVIESTPEQRDDVMREADTDWSVGMPKKNTAKKMLARFQSIQAEANKDSPRPEARKESESESSSSSPTNTTTAGTGSADDPAMQNALRKFEDPDKVGRSKSMRAAIQVEKCGACDKTVYAMERLEMNKRVYHRACFRCSQCKSVLTAKTFAINNDVIFCTTHYKQLFTRKGNYDEGFGRSQHKTRWNSNPNIADAVNKEGADGSRSQTEVKS